MNATKLATYRLGLLLLLSHHLTSSFSCSGLSGLYTSRTPSVSFQKAGQHFSNLQVPEHQIMPHILLFNQARSIASY